MVDQQCRLEQGRSAPCRREGRAGRARVRQPDADVPSDASARARVSGGRHRRLSLLRRGARHHPGPPELPRDGGLRRQQSRLLGAALPPALSSRRRHVHDPALRRSPAAADVRRTVWLCANLTRQQIRLGSEHGNVYIEPRPKGRAEGTPIEDYVVEDHKDHVLKTFKTQKEAIDWAKKEGHHPLSPASGTRTTRRSSITGGRQAEAPRDQD